MKEDYVRKDIPKTERNGFWFADYSLIRYAEKVREERLRNEETYD